MASKKHRTPLKARTYSPSFLSPNNDDYEKEQARVARAAARKRKSLLVGAALDFDSNVRNSSSVPLLSKDQVQDLFQNCIKLAAENKINQRNTWDLGLIDHLSEVIKTEDQNDSETNFQKASCTLEAGVKIYSYRVDSVHSETFKVLGGLNRTTTNEKSAHDEEAVEDSNTELEDQEHPTKESQKKVLSSSATLESSYEALNVKHFDEAFAVDPLFHQTSAQFDEGGAKGLLLNTLSVYNGCSIVFDSSDIPSRKANVMVPSDTQRIETSFIKDILEEIAAIMKSETEISPALNDITSLLDDPYRAAELSKPNVATEGGPWYDDDETISPAEEDVPVVPDDDNTGSFEPFAVMSPGSVISGTHETGPDDQEDDFVEVGGDVSGWDEETTTDEATLSWVATGLGMETKTNSWAGPDHWKYQKEMTQHVDVSATSSDKDKKKRPKKEKFSLDFLNPPSVDMNAFAPPKLAKSLILPQSSSSVSTLLPEDCHYQAEHLVRLFLLPSIMCINQKGRKRVGSRARNVSLGGGSSFGAEWCEDANGGNDDWDDGNTHSDVEDPLDDSLLPQPHKVQKIEVNYDKVSKQIDVRVLKETLWDQLEKKSSCTKNSTEEAAEQAGVTFHDILGSITMDSRAVDAEDISVHLCFICLLHLANEHNLRIKDCDTLDELYIFDSS